MKKWLRWFLPVMTLGLACSSALAAPVELSVWGWLPGSTNGDIFAKYVAEFNATHPGIVVKVEKGSNEQQVVVAYAAGNAPDLVQGVGSLATSLGSRGLLLPLDKYIDGPQGLTRSDFIDDIWSFSQVGGQTYQLAADANERALFVAVDSAQSAGVDVRQPMRDWNDLLAWAKKMTFRNADGVQRWGYDVNQENGGGRWTWVWMNDGAIFNDDNTKAVFDDPNTVQAVEFAADMVNSYGVSPLPGGLKGGASSNFISGNLAMMTSLSTSMPNLDKQGKQYVTFPGPVGVGKKGGRFSGATASVMAIMRSSKHPAEAWTFLRWLMYEKGVDFANDRGGIPYLKKGLRSERFQKQPWNAFAYSITTYKPHSPYMAGVSESDWTPAFDTAWSQSLKGEQSAKIALRQAAEAVTARLAELRNK